MGQDLSKKYEGLCKEFTESTNAVTKGKLLKDIARFFTTHQDEKHNPQFVAMVQNSNLMPSIANFACENSSKKDIVDVTVRTFYACGTLRCKFPLDQLLTFVELAKKLFPVYPAQALFVLITVSFDRDAIAHLLNDATVYQMVKTALGDDTPNVRDRALVFLQQCGAHSDDWQFKLLSDQEFVAQIPSIGGKTPKIFQVLFVISQHPDAKTLIPRDILEFARQKHEISWKWIRAALCNEEDAATLAMDKEVVEGIAIVTKDYLRKSTTKDVQSLSILSVLLPIVNLSVSDSYKESLGKHTISSLLEILALEPSNQLADAFVVCLPRAKREATKALWNLAFLESNRNLIEKAGGIDTLKQTLQRTDDEALQKNINGVLYMFPQLEPPKEQPHRSTDKHVMISYNWSHQPTILRLAKSLKEHGITVWLDVEQMKGSTLVAMASAIENASLILVCMSQRYKDSPNCRLEAEYCVNRRVPYIPLMMQHGYVPDGWLGLVLGAKFYHNFSDESNWSKKVSALIKEIENNGVTSANATPPDSLPAEKQATAPTSTWTNEDVVEWLKAESLETHTNAFVNHGVDGAALMELKTIVLSSPQNVCTFFDRMEIKGVGDVLKITAAVRKLQ